MVAKQCEVNKMEVRNLAIVFGPTLVRPADDNMLSMVTDMAQQCRIIETILNNCEWFFDEDEDEDMRPADMVRDAVEPVDSKLLHPVSQTGNEILLLNNLQKLEDSGKVSSPGREVSAKDIVSGIISAANRKMQRAANKNKRDFVDSSASAMIQRPVVASVPSPVANSSRRNSESVIQSAVSIAAAVPQLMGNAAAMSKNNASDYASLSNISETVSLSSHRSTASAPCPASPCSMPKIISASAENVGSLPTTSLKTDQSRTLLVMQRMQREGKTRIYVNFHVPTSS
jgi:hypothetical protein